MENQQTLPSSAPRTRRILLAEDDGAMRAMLARVLRRAGLEVVEARNGSETLELLAYAFEGCEGRFDLVISDVRMPGYDGLNVLASIRELPNRAPLILITAFGTAAAHATARRLGAFAMLDKPFELADLLELIRAALWPPDHVPTSHA
jgi:two-component system response regulator (stage 0 sporulation protein F)